MTEKTNSNEIVVLIDIDGRETGFIVNGNEYRKIEKQNTDEFGRVDRFAVNDWIRKNCTNLWDGQL